MITTSAEVLDLTRRIYQAGNLPIAVDCETEGIDPRSEPAAGPLGRIVCWSISWLAGQGQHKSAVIWHNPETSLASWSLRDLPVVGHNIYGFDRHMFRKSGIPLNNIIGDTLRLSQLANPADGAEHGLKALMQWRLGIKPVGAFEDLFKRRRCTGVSCFPEEGVVKKRTIQGSKVTFLGCGEYSTFGAATETIPLSEIPVDYPHLLPVLEKYAALDAAATLMLWHKLTAELQGKPWTPPLSQTSGIPPAQLFPTWRPLDATLTRPPARPRTPEQPPICTR